jgi:hypothetical protein
MKYIFNQFQGLGDILFCEPIARYFYKNGINQIIWPINEEFLWLNEYLPYINFVSKQHYNFNWESTYLGQVGDEYHIPLRFANPIYRKLHPHDYSDQYHTMLDKYRFLNLNTSMWRTLKWSRNIEKENELFFKHDLSDNQPYILINNNWSANTVNIQISNNNNYPIIYMNKIDNYTMLDWAKIIENAREIHTVSTSNLYMIETLNITANSVCIYPRRPRENNFDGISEFVNTNFLLKL